MEVTALFTLPLILFLSLTTNGVSARHGISIVDQSPAVLDIDGNSLRAGEYYYLRPKVSFRPAAGAIFIGVFNYVCRPLLLVEILLPAIVGVPAKFSPLDGDEVIRESTDLYIEFPDKLSPTCGSSLLGVLADQTTLSLGAVKDDPSSVFEIEKGQDVNFYKFVSPLYGRDIGTSRPSSELGTQNLILSDNTLEFVFSPYLPQGLKNEASNISF